MAQTPEGRVKADIKKFLKREGFIAAGEPIPEGGCAGWYYMPVQNGMGVVGIPDFICCWSGAFLAIEAKAPGKQNGTTANQKNRLAEIISADGVALVVDDVEQLAAAFEGRMDYCEESHA